MTLFSNLRYVRVFLTSINAHGHQAHRAQRVNYATTMSLRGPVLTLTARRGAPSLRIWMDGMGRSINWVLHLSLYFVAI